MRGPTPRYKLSPTVPETVAMSAGGSKRPFPEEEGGLVDDGPEVTTISDAGNGGDGCGDGDGDGIWNGSGKSKRRG
eukprot:scaffold65928_cov42-Tisochrysis_lutea.AAC.1